MNTKRKRIWFISDTHWNHANVIKFNNRPFSDVTEMDEALIKNWNDRVDPEDDVYHLGDFALSSSGRALQILNQLNGNIHLIKGNHEKSVLKKDYTREKFVWIKDYYELKVQDTDVRGNIQNIVLCHYGMRVWNKSHYGSWHLYGHSHGSLPSQGLSFDVGVDCHDYHPISYEEVKEIMSHKTFKPIDHHSR